MKILCLVNTLTSVNSFVYANHITFFNHIKKYFPTLEMLFFSPHRMSIDHARNEAARLALECEADYLMFIDDDVLVPPNALEGMLECESDIAAGLVIIRGWPFNVMAFKFTKDSTPEIPRIAPIDELPREYNGISCSKEKLIDEVKMTENDFKALPLTKMVICGAVGFSCALIKIDLLKKLQKPLFVTGLNCTEDIYFCLKALEYYPETSIIMNTDIRCGHLMPQEPIEWDTREKFRTFYKPTVDEAHVRNLSFLNKTLSELK